MKGLLPLFRNLRITSFKKGAVIIPTGSTQKDLVYLRKGLVRSYYTNDNCDEITFQLYPESQVFGNLHCILFDEPSKFTYQAIEDTKTYVIDHDLFHSVVNNSKFLKLNRLGLGKKGMRQAFQRVESFVLLSPEERYLKYMEDYPNVINRAPDKYIANVLGITAVSLSRIKARITAKRHA